MHTPAWELFPYERSTIFVREPALAGPAPRRAFEEDQA